MMQTGEHDHVDRTAEDAPPSQRRPYVKPAFHHEQVFETMALACGKLRGTQGQCRRLLSNS